MRVPFTEQEKRIIAEYIAKNPHNLQKAFRDCAKCINHSVKAITTFYYRNRKQATPMFATVSKEIALANTKNVREPQTLSPVTIPVTGKTIEIEVEGIKIRIRKY